MTDVISQLIITAIMNAGPTIMGINAETLRHVPAREFFSEQIKRCKGENRL